MQILKRSTNHVSCRPMSRLRNIHAGSVVGALLCSGPRLCQMVPPGHVESTLNAATLVATFMP